MLRAKHVAAFVVLAALAAEARADDPKVEITVAPKKAEVTVGENLELDVSVKNIGKEPAELIELVFDRQSVSIELTYTGKKTFTDEQIHDDVRNPKSYPKKKLGPGESMSKTFLVPTLKAGELEVSATYEVAKKKLGSEPKKVKVLPTKDGAEEVVAKVRTNVGPLTIRFLTDDALATAINFVRLAKDGFYDGRVFHRVVRSENMGVVQGGDPKGDGSGGPGFNVPQEFNDQKHTVGRLSMARRGDSVDSAGSQFFIVTKDTPHLDKNYTVFAEVVKGQDVVTAMGEVRIAGGSQDGAPVDKLVMESVRIEPLPKE
jgi:peptidyl-prolyl cis-trans isomerase B (cyclophilin B)